MCRRIVACVFCAITMTGLLLSGCKQDPPDVEGIEDAPTEPADVEYGNEDDPNSSIQSGGKDGDTQDEEAPAWEPAPASTSEEDETPSIAVPEFNLPETDLDLPTDVPGGSASKTPNAGTGAVAERLSALIADGDKAALDAATEAMVSQGAEAVPQLVECLQSAQWKVRSYAAFTLGSMGAVAAPAQDELQQLAAGDENESVQAAAKYALAAIKPSGGE